MASDNGDAKDVTKEQAEKDEKDIQEIREDPNKWEDKQRKKK